MASLTSGFCQLVCNSAETPDVHPTLQVLNVKPIKSPQGPDRYR